MIKVLNLEQMRADSKILDSVPPEVRGHRIEEMHFTAFPENDDLMFRQAAHDAIEITELKRTIIEMDPQAECERQLAIAEAETARHYYENLSPDYLLEDNTENFDDPGYDDPNYNY